MAYLIGHPASSPTLTAVIPGAPGGIPIGGPTRGPMPANAQAIVVDGTPIRVVIYALSAAAGLWALRLAGFKFNVGVSS